MPALPLTRPFVQVGYAVGDVRDAARLWASRFGAGPFFVRDHIPLSEVQHRGRPAVFDHSSAYGQWGGVMVELVQQHEVSPSTLADDLRSGDVGLHHLSWFAPHLEQERLRLMEAGWPEVLTATTAGGLQFSFLDARRQLGHLVELYEASDRLLGFYRTVAEAADGWDGGDPLRDM